MRLAECHITRPEVQHCHHLWVFDLRRRAGDIRRPMSLASMHVVPPPYNSGDSTWQSGSLPPHGHGERS
jgi:hypothetical protein